MEQEYRIMIVDDEKIVREAIAVHIPWEQYGIRIVEAASNAIEALEYMKVNDVDLMLVDIRMPVMDGIELLKRVKKNKPDVDVIILSGYADFKYAQEALRYGARDYLLKPVEQSELIRVIINCKNKRNGKNFYEDMQNSFMAVPKPMGMVHYSRTIEKILKIVQEEISNEKLSLKWISSQKLFLNENYLSKLFQKEVGQKFSAYLLEQRMFMAMNFLTSDEELLIAEAAKAVGFGENSQYFSSTFKKYTGYTPTEYRKYIKESNR